MQNCIDGQTPPTLLCGGQGQVPVGGHHHHRLRCQEQHTGDPQ